MGRSIAIEEQTVLSRMSASISALTMDAVEAARSGHPGMPMGMADVATVLCTQFLKFDAKAPDWPDRDRFILSAGHGSMLIYALTYLLGYEGMDIAQIKNFRKLGSKTAGHPEFGHAPGVEVTTGPLGQGIANAVGFALAEAHLAARFGEELVNHHTYVIAGDGCLMEGVSQEAISLAGHLKLHKLIVLWDDNQISIDGPVSLSDSTDQIARFRASGWDVACVDGHDMQAVAQAIAQAQNADKPSMIACRTIIGRGADKKAGSNSAHGAPLGAEEIAFARQRLDWPYPPFEVPAEILSRWRQSGADGVKARTDWESRLVASPQEGALAATLAGEVPSGFADAMKAHKNGLYAAPKKVATRQASQMALEVINEIVPFTLGGSADLTGSNNTRTAQCDVLSKDNYAGRYMHYGIREHGMSAAMNGMALHGGVLPYGGGFLVFSDYCRAAMRLSALMRLQVAFVMTHDSIGLGEDGPTHQPVEHLAALRAIPGLHVFRPADVIETAECWEAVLALKDAPSVLVLSRQGLAQCRLTPVDANLSWKGGYVLHDAVDYDVTLLATGSEIGIAVEVKDTLAAEGVCVRVVSLPCMELFMAQDECYRAAVLGDKPRLAIEAAIRQGWDHSLYAFGNTKADFLGMEGFGASAPAADLYTHFGITAENAITKVKALLDQGD